MEKRLREINSLFDFSNKISFLFEEEVAYLICLYKKEGFCGRKAS